MATYENIKIASFNVLDSASNYRVGVTLGYRLEFKKTLFWILGFLFIFLGNSIEIFNNQTTNNVSNTFINIDAIKHLGNQSGNKTYLNKFKV